MRKSVDLEEKKKASALSFHNIFFHKQSLVLFDAITILGGLWFLLFCCLLLFLFKQLFVSSILLFGLLLGYVLIIPFRLLYFKERPKKKAFKTLWQRIDASSFPSMHAYRAGFVLVVFWQFVYISLVYAFLICVSRIILKKHDVYDVLFGLALGVLSALTLLVYV